MRAAAQLRRNGVLAVFVVRKIPGPFTLMNIALGASPVRLRDFLGGTLLGMGPGVIALAGFGYQVSHIWRDPSLETLAIAIALAGGPLLLAWLLNRALRRERATA
jgi:uncharacterized membrane protein YdjX (TVP38/TMEM64 family)